MEVSMECCFALSDHSNTFTDNTMWKKMVLFTESDNTIICYEYQKTCYIFLIVTNYLDILLIYYIRNINNMGQDYLRVELLCCCNYGCEEIIQQFIDNSLIYLDDARLLTKISI